MFMLTVTDHVRLDSEHVARNYTVHARAAERLAGTVLWIRIAIVALLLAATAASVANLLFQARADQIAAVAAASLALVGFVLYTVLGLEGRVMAHRSFAQRLWLVAERYRALMTEVDDGFVERSALLSRRDELIRDLHAIYDGGFSADQSGYEPERLAALTDTRPSEAPSSGTLPVH